MNRFYARRLTRKRVEQLAATTVTFGDQEFLVTDCAGTVLLNPIGIMMLGVCYWLPLPPMCIYQQAYGNNGPYYAGPRRREWAVLFSGELPGGSARTGN